MLTLLVSACAPREPGPVQPWRFEARRTHGIVRVLPVLVDHAPIERSDDDYVGAGVTWFGEWLRKERREAVEQVPVAMAKALPGALTLELGERWDGHFLNGDFPVGTRRAVLRGLRGKVDLDAELESVSRGTSEAMLLCWVTDLRAHSLMEDGFPGDILDTEAGPVVVDTLEEPHLVEARVGIALVAPDGEVVLRYTDGFSTVVSAHRDARAAGRDLAMGLAREVAKVWALDPRLGD